MKPIEFFEATQRTLNDLAGERGIKNLDRYYQLTDLQDSSIARYEGLAQVFAQMAFHAQNATMLSNIVKFEKNVDFLDKTLCHFDPKEFLENYNPGNIENPSSQNDIVSRMVKDFRFNDKTGEGLKWNSSKSKNGRKDALVQRYAKSLLDCAVFIRNFESRDDFLENLKKHYVQKDYEEIIKYFRRNVHNGFSIALTCDFLKEFDKTFEDLPKPDVHIMDVMCKLLHPDNEDYYANTDKRAYECIRDMQTITSEINESLDTDKQITVYQLDRMIWLVCTGDFYLDYTQDPKSLYLKKINKIDW